MKKLHVLKKDNVYIKSIEQNDIELMRKWRNNDSIRNCFLSNSKITKSQQKSWFSAYEQKDNDFMFLIYYNDLPVGTVSLYNIDQYNKTAEFGRLMIGEISSRGKGLGVIATNLMCEFGFNILMLGKIVLEVFSDNSYAKNAYIACGFKFISEKVENGKMITLMEKVNV